MRFQTWPVPNWPSNSIVVQFKLCFSHFFNTSTSGGGCTFFCFCFFYRPSWSAMWVNWARFLECPRQQYHFPSGTLGCFQTLLVFSHFLQTLILLRITVRSGLRGFDCMSWAAYCWRRTWLRLHRQPWITSISLLSKQYCQLSGSRETTEVWPFN